MKMTSAYANKLLNQFNEEKDYWVENEKVSSTYIAAVNEEPVVPEYDYKKVADKITELDSKICIIKHAINIANTNASINIDGRVMAVDEILITMAQFNKRKSVLERMRKQQVKARITGDCFQSRHSTQPEYQYINYDLEYIKKEYDRISKMILILQMNLDKYNQTYEFEVEI